MHGTVAAVAALQRSDLLIALGTRFDDRVTGKLDSFAPEAKVIHADIDPAEIGKNRNADVPIVGDVKAVIADLIEALRRDGTAAGTIKMDNWWEYLRGVQATYPLSYGPQSDGSLSPEYVIEQLGKIAGPDAVYVAGVGQHQMWAAQFISYENPRTWINSGGLGTMGFAVPAAMGAKFARPDAEVWAIDGDGCFQMTNQELATCAVEGAPIKVAIINNGNLGMVRQWQTLFYEERYSQTDLATHSHRIPDFVKLAEALGCVGLRCERAEDVVDVINQARAINDRPVVIDFVVGADAQVWPMVAAGTGNDEIQAARGHPAAVRRSRRRACVMVTPTHTLSVLVEDKPGVLARVASLFSRRGYNIQSLAVGATEQKDMSRMTIVVSVDEVAARADHQAAQQADQRDQDRRAGRGQLGVARTGADQGARRCHHPQPGDRSGEPVPRQGR